MGRMSDLRSFQFTELKKIALKGNVNKFLFALLALLCVNSVFYSWYTTADDAISATISLSELGKHVWDDAVLTGRITHLVSDVLFWIPHGVNSFYWFKAFAVVPVILNLIFIPLLLFRYGYPREFCYLAIIASMIFFQNDKHHAQATSFVFAYTSSYLIGVFAVERYLGFLKDRKNHQLISAGILLLTSSYVYESNYVVFLGLIFGLGLLSYFSKNTNFKILVISQFFLFFLTLLLYLVPYFLFRKFYPSSYVGAIVSTELSFKVIFDTLYAFSSGSFLFSNFSSIWPVIKLDNLTILIGNILSSIDVIGLIYTALIGYLSFRILSTIQSLPPLKRWQVLAICFSVVWLFFSPNFLIAITPQYQRWAATGSRIHAGTYLSGFGLAICAALVLFLLAKTLSSHRFYRYISLMLSGVIAATALCTYAANREIALRQSVDTARWNAFTSLIDQRSEIADRLLAGGQLWLAPDLWVNSFWGLQHTYPGGKDYWTNYFRANSLDIRVLGQGGQQEWKEFQSQCLGSCSDVSFVRFFPFRFGNFVFALGRDFQLSGWSEDRKVQGSVRDLEVYWNVSDTSGLTSLDVPQTCGSNVSSSIRLSLRNNESESISHARVTPDNGCRLIIDLARLR
jgi:hypothetical protein